MENVRGQGLQMTTVEECPASHPEHGPCGGRAGHAPAPGGIHWTLEWQYGEVVGVEFWD